MFLAMLSTQEILTTYVGVRLGLYETLADAGPLTASQLALKAGIDKRYAREWLEQQAAAGLLVVDDPRKEQDSRAYVLPPSHAEVLTVSDSPLSMVSLTVLPVGAIARALPRLLDAFRTGQGVPDAEYGDDWRQGHSGANRALFANYIAVWIATFLPDVDRRLRRHRARIADLACGTGWAAISLAKAYGGAHVDAFDRDAYSLAQGRERAIEHGVSDRVEFIARDIAEDLAADSYELVCLFDSLHEISQPVEVLRNCLRISGPDGCVLLMDARVAESFTAPADEVERFQYATSVLHCLPASLSDHGSAGIGTVMRPEAVRKLATIAGFRDVQQIAVDDRFHRLYRLVH